MSEPIGSQNYLIGTYLNIANSFADQVRSIPSRLENIQSSVRSFGHSCRDQFTNHFQRQNHENNHNNDNNTHLNNNHQNNENNSSSSNPFIENTSETNNTDSPTLSDENINGVVNVTTPTPASQRNINQRSSRSTRRGRHCRDRENLNTYHHLCRGNGLVTVRSIDVKDRNILAAVLSIIVIAVLATALAQPKWFSIYNDLCAPRYFSSTKSDKVTNDESVSIFEFQTSHSTQWRPQYYYNGPFNSMYSAPYALAPVTIYGLTPDYKICANPLILALKRTIIGLCFLAIMCTLVQFFMDTIGTKRKMVNFIRVYAVGNIVCVLICVLIIGLCYFISVLYERVQLQQLFSKKSPSAESGWMKHTIINRPLILSQADYLTIHQIEVKFELSYYLVTLAGFLSILASAANLFRRPRQILIERISQVNSGCHRRHHHHQTRSTQNGDENSLLSSDVLSNNTSQTDSPTNHYLPPYRFSAATAPNDPNINLFCNTRPLQQQNLTNLSTPPTFNSNNRSSSNQHNFILPPPLVALPPCPPPPPYTP